MNTYEASYHLLSLDHFYFITVAEFRFENSTENTAEFYPSGQSVEICLLLISGILTFPIDITLRPESGDGPTGADGMD